MIDDLFKFFIPILVPTLIIIGWGISYWSVKDNRKKTAISHLIKKKDEYINQIDRNIQDFFDISDFEVKREIQHDLRETQQIYKKLHEQYKVSCAVKGWGIIQNLRRLATYIDNVSELTEDERSQRKKQIEDMLRELEDIPDEVKHTL